MNCEFGVKEQIPLRCYRCMKCSDTAFILKATISFITSLVRFCASGNVLNSFQEISSLHLEMSANIKLKQHWRRIQRFNKAWSSKYIFAEIDRKALSLLCGEHWAVFKDFSFNFPRILQDMVNYLSLSLKSAALISSDKKKRHSRKCVLVSVLCNKV